MAPSPTLLDATNKVLLITGAAGGIGSAIVDLYRASGGSVIAVDQAQIEESEHILSCVGDGSDEAVIEAAVASGIDRFGRIDAVGHAIGISAPGPLTEITLDDWNRVMQVNLTSAFLLARATFPFLKASGGSLVFIASSSGRNGGTTATGPAYAASKGGMINLARYLAKEWAPDGIRVNSVAPGPVMTPMMKAAGAVRQSDYAKSMLTGALAKPAEIAAAVCFLFSGHARSITGAMLNTSGGLVLD